MTLLTDIQAVADRYAAARTGYDAAHAAGDKGAMVLHGERLDEAEKAWRPLAHEFAKGHSTARPPIEAGMSVVWVRGAVGLQGVVTGSLGVGGLVQVQTPRGVFAEYAGNLMPLEAVSARSES